MTQLEGNSEPIHTAIDPVLAQWGPGWLRAITAFVVGGTLMQSGFTLLDVHLEYFSGLQSFNASWLFAMSILPVGSGVLIGLIYGFGGKYLAHFPPAAVLIMAYYQSMQVPVPVGSHLLPIGMMTMFIILQMEFCAVGAFLGEIFIRRRFGWNSKYAPKTNQPHHE
ncbi:MAG: hypothetical protein Q9M31_05475 [Mariprofundus sp.]|nr:hypothetical protein [Mariprofundus sp.]